MALQTKKWVLDVSSCNPARVHEIERLRKPVVPGKLQGSLPVKYNVKYWAVPQHLNIAL